MAGSLNKMGSPAIKVRSMPEHVHILCLLSKTMAPCKLIEEIKTGSSKWLKTQSPALDLFQWQNGYGIFSVSESNINTIIRYVEHQEEHHRQVTFQDELRALLKEHEVQYDERYVWD